MNGNPKETETMKRDKIGTTQPAETVMTIGPTIVRHKETTIAHSITKERVDTKGMKGQEDTKGREDTTAMQEETTTDREEAATEDHRVEEITTGNRKEADMITGNSILPTVRATPTILVPGRWMRAALL